MFERVRQKKKTFPKLFFTLYLCQSFFCYCFDFYQKYKCFFYVDNFVIEETHF